MLKTNEIFNETYQIVREIGHGGMGTIYLARHLRLQKDVVLKRIRTNCDHMDVRVEADLLKNLHHPRLPQIYDFFCRDGEVYTVIDYIAGTDLRRIPCGPGHITEQQAVKWLRQLAEVMDYLHTQKKPILHSDIKPGNIILTPEQDICLIDFNISLEDWQPGKLSGFSPNFASPEQMRMAQRIKEGRPSHMRLDARTDIYSAGATFYYLLTGVLPDGTQESPPLESWQGLPFSPGLLAIVDKCMAWQRERRYANAKKLLGALDNLKKQDKRYRNYLALQAASWLCSAVLAAGAAFCLVQGTRAVRLENYHDDYGAFCKAVEAEAGEQIISLGLDLLNEPGYQSILKEDGAEKASILHAVGDTYYRDGNTQGALRYYADALAAAAEDENPELYYLDYAIVLAESGRNVEAQNVLSRAEEAGVSQPALLLIQAGIQCRAEDISKCLETVEQLLKTEAKSEQCIRACMIAASAVGKETPEGLSWLEKAREYGEEPGLLRMLGAAYLEQGRPDGFSSSQAAYAEKALECYTVLCARAYPAFEDRLGLAVTQYVLGKNRECIRLLLSCAKAGETDYRIDLYLAFAYHNVGDDSSAASRCSSALRKLDGLPSEQSQSETGEEREALSRLQQELEA